MDDPVKKGHDSVAGQHDDSRFALHPDMVSFVQNAIEEGDGDHIRSLAGSMHVADQVELINQLDTEQRENFLEAIAHDIEPEILVGLEGKIKDQVLDLLGAEKSAEAINQLESDDAIQVIEDLEKRDQDNILEAIPKEKRAELEEGLSYPDDSAGRLMNPRFVSVPQEWTVGHTIDYLREETDLPDDFYEVFVTDDMRKPVGGVLVSRIIRKNRDTKLADITYDDLKTINVTLDQEEVAYIFRKYGLASAPVVDGKGGMVGIISLDDIVDIIDEEAEEDIMRLGGISASDLYSSSVKTAVHRAPWLFVNLLTAIGASAVIALFATEIEKLVALAVLMPIVASMAGNAGTQTLTIAVRSLATKELTEANSIRIIKKEILASMINGLLFAVIVAVSSWLYYGNWYLSLVFAGATLFALVLAAFAGVMIPITIIRSGVDPAIASGVFLTTVTDVSAFFIFLGLASLWLF